MTAGGHGVEWLSKAVHIHGGLHDGIQAGLAQGIRHAQAVDDCAQHTHLIRGYRVHVCRGTLTAAPDVAGADDDADFHTHIMHPANNGCHFVNFFKIKEIGAGFERFAAELQQDPVIYSHIMPPKCIFISIS